MVARRNPTKQEETDTSEKKETSAEVVNLRRGDIPDDVVQSFNSFEDLHKYFGTENVSTAKELGDGYELTDEKTQFVGQEIFLVDWEFLPGDFKIPEGTKPFPGQGMYSTIRLMTRDGGKYRISDGSSGIHKQLFEFSLKHGKQSGMFCRKGLTESHYENEYTDNGVTYYLNTSG